MTLVNGKLIKDQLSDYRKAYVENTKYNEVCFLGDNMSEEGDFYGYSKKIPQLIDNVFIWIILIPDYPTKPTHNGASVSRNL